MPVFLLYDQNLDRQISILTEYGCEKIVKEKFTGTIKDRKGLHQLFDMLRNGDTVVVESISRLGRKTWISSTLFNSWKRPECNSFL